MIILIIFPFYANLQVSWHLWAGDAKNRFYDKQQLIVFPNGKSGFMGEHSTMDGTPTLRLNDFMLSALAANKIDHGSSSRSLPAPKAISFSVDRNVESLIKDSLQRFNDLMGRHELAVLDYQGYGKNAIKAFKCSPDAWVQMVIQLAYYKMYGKPAPTYESAQTRKFKLGRTETIRSASVESKAFCEAMEDVNGSDAVRLERFQAAVKQHLAYATAAADGQGVDRHLFGLKKVLKEGEKLPEIYNDPAFALTSTWLLSTSQISSESFEWVFFLLCVGAREEPFTDVRALFRRLFQLLGLWRGQRGRVRVCVCDQERLAHVHAYIAQAAHDRAATPFERGCERAACAAPACCRCPTEAEAMRGVL